MPKGYKKYMPKAHGKHRRVGSYSNPVDIEFFIVLRLGIKQML